MGKADADAVDSVTGATITSEAVKTAVASALAAAKGEATEAAEIAFVRAPMRELLPAIMVTLY